MQKLKPKAPPSSLNLYVRTTIFSLVIFGLFYAYSTWLGARGVTNKSAADTAIFLMGLSMLLSSLGYFLRMFGPLIVYRKYLGLVGFAYGVAHLLLSWSAFEALLKPITWQQGQMWPALSGALALAIFTIMALVSNSHLARMLGSKWRPVLRTGYIAVILILAHVVLLKSGRWITWYQGGMKSLPALSLLISVFMVVVVLMRIALWLSLKKNKVA